MISQMTQQDAITQCWW